MITCTRRLAWCSGHRIMNHESKCRHLHGHQYTAEVTAQSEALDDLGRVVDFGVLKSVLQTWIDEHWDHGFIIFQEDDEAKSALLRVDHQKLFLLPYNPTAENIAVYLGERVAKARLIGYGITVTRVVVHETPNCFATVEFPPYIQRIRRDTDHD